VTSASIAWFFWMVSSVFTRMMPPDWRKPRPALSRIESKAVRTATFFTLSVTLPCTSSPITTFMRCSLANAQMTSRTSASRRSSDTTPRGKSARAVPQNRVVAASSTTNA